MKAKLAVMKVVIFFMMASLATAGDVGVARTVWQTIKLGTGLKTGEDFYKALKENGFAAEGVRNMLGKPEFTVATKETEVDLVAVTVAELGFKDGADRKDVYAKAQQLGLQLCPAEVGPQLRLQYKFQHHETGFIIGMKPICSSVFSSGDYLAVFDVEEHNSNLLLAPYFESFCSANNWFYKWVFILPRKAVK
ncbi:MAG: hypothetical protein NTY04_03235 [Candidatus Staskawiczbacteria bacterium]|nr:hypothetical protein [Candidatus Staskawiczbacteria bacterium]